MKIKIFNSKIEGECIIKQIDAIKYHRVLHYFIIVFSIVPLLGIPLLLLLWFPRLRRALYYQSCKLQQATHVWAVNVDEQEEAVKLHYGSLALTLNKYMETYYFTNRFLKYYLKGEQFQAVEYDYSQELLSFTNGDIRGLTHTQADQHYLTYGMGMMQFQRNSCWKLIYIEVTRPFFLFVVFCIIQMCFTDYVAFGMCILAFTLVTLYMTITEKMNFDKEMEDMSTKERDYKVLRNNRVMDVSNRFIVPGDVVFVVDGSTPFDGIMLEGTVLIDESSLTGQSFPVSKKELSFKEFATTKKIPGQSNLFEGTRFIQSNNAAHKQHESYGIAMLVTLTSYSSYKGQIMRTIKFPKNSLVEFERQAFLFVFAIFIMILVVDTLLFKVVTRDPWLHNKYLRNILMALVIAVPPQLPTCMNVAAVYAQKRLKKNSILTNNIPKIIENGRVDLICFDKTGTLTRKDMQFQGYLPSRQSQQFAKEELVNAANRHKFFELESSNQQVAVAAKAFACCHSLQYVISTNKVDGDPIEVELFKFGGYQLDNKYQDAKYPNTIARVRRLDAGTKPLDLVILRRFEFNSDDKKMSTICQDLSDGKTYVFTKGSPESMAAISKMPNGFQQVLSKYTHQGLRVLSVGYKQLQQGQIQSIQRKEAESNLSFIGLVIFENKLKQESPDIIATLMKNQIRCVMLTGDNLETARSIAKQLNFNPDEVRARCTPQQKSQYVQEYKKQGFKVMMCGDGVNDMLALKTAHIGYGVDGGWGMDFIGAIGGVLTILQEGRASMVAGVAMVKIIVTYALLQFIAQTIASLMYADLHNAHYIYLDVVLDIVPIMLLPLTMPKPLTLDRPYSSILNYPTYVSISVPVLTGLFMSLALVYKQQYKLQNIALNAEIQDGDPTKSNITVSLLFIIAAGLTAGSLASMDWKYSWRRENCLIMIYAILGWLFVHAIPHIPWLFDLFAMTGQNKTIIWHMILWTDVAVILTFLFERLVVYRIAKCYTNKQLKKKE